MWVHVTVHVSVLTHTWQSTCLHVTACDLHMWLHVIVHTHVTVHMLPCDCMWLARVTLTTLAAVSGLLCSRLEGVASSTGLSATLLHTLQHTLALRMGPHPLSGRTLLEEAEQHERCFSFGEDWGCEEVNVVYYILLYVLLSRMPQVKSDRCLSDVNYLYCVCVCL